MEWSQEHPDEELLSRRALNLLEHEDHAALEAHLQGCAFCRFRANKIQELVDILPYAAPVTEPPMHLKTQVFSRIGQPPTARARRIHNLWLHALAVLCVVGVVVLGAQPGVAVEGEPRETLTPRGSVQLGF